MFKFAIEDLDKALKNFSVEELDEFFQKNKRLYEREFVKQWEVAPYRIKEMTLCKMILYREDMGEDLKERAVNRLNELKEEIQFEKA